VCVHAHACAFIYLLAGTAITKCFKLSDLKNRNLLSYTSGGWTFTIKVSTVLVPSEGHEGRSAPDLSLASGIP
jgi:hypothetical protein